MFIVTHFLTVLFLVLAVSAHPRKRSDVNIDINTNAGRLARGLPLLRPRFSNILPGRSPTRVHGMLATSYDSIIWLTGMIQPNGPRLQMSLCMVYRCVDPSLLNYFELVRGLLR